MSKVHDSHKRSKDSKPDKNTLISKRVAKPQVKKISLTYRNTKENKVNLIEMKSDLLNGPRITNKNFEKSADSVFDWSSYENLFNSIDSNDPLRTMAVWAEDDIVVINESRKSICRIMPDEFNPQKHSYINELSKIFVKNWIRIQRNYSYPINPNKDRYQSIPTLVYEVDMNNSIDGIDASDGADEYTAAFLRYINEISSKEYSQKDQLLSSTSLKEDNLCLFQTYPMAPASSVCDIKTSPFPDDPEGPHILIEPTQLSFDFGLYEPFYIQISIYDLKLRQKVSETRHLELNPPEVLELLGPHLGPGDPVSLALKTLFTVSYASPDLYFVFVFTKTLRGDEEKLIGPYLYSKIKEKEKEKYIVETRNSILRFGNYRQAFGYFVVQIFDEKGEFRLKKTETAGPGLLKCKLDRDIYSWIEKYSEAIKNNKSKNFIPIKFSYNADLIDNEKNRNEIKYIISPYLSNLKFTRNTNSVRKLEIVRQMCDLNPTHEYPSIQYANTMFLIPDSINFTRFNFNSSRNIAIEVQLFGDDKNLTKEGLTVFYGNTNTSVLVNSARTLVVYHNKKPQFIDEIKINLPIYLTNHHHLVVSFYHVSCSDKSKPSQTPQTLLARTVIPIYSGNRLISDGKYSYPVILNLPNSNYLNLISDPSSGSTLKWMDGGKSIFSFHLKTISTIYPQDDSLNTYFKSFEDFTNPTNSPEVYEPLLINSIIALQNTEKSFLISYFPAIFMTFFKLLDLGSQSLHIQIFNIFLFIIDSISTSTNSCNLLYSYIDHLLGSIQNKIPLSQELLGLWCISLLQPTHYHSSCQYSHVLFRLIIKCMVIEMNDSGLFNPEKNFKPTPPPRVSDDSSADSTQRNPAKGDHASKDIKPWNTNKDSKGKYNRKDRFPQEYSVLLKRLIEDLATKARFLCFLNNDNLNTDKSKNRDPASSSGSGAQVNSTSGAAGNNPDRHDSSSEYKYTLTRHALKLVEDVARFIRDLFSIYDRGQVFRFSYLFLKVLTPMEEKAFPLIQLKFIFLKSITEYEHYVCLNLPLEIDIEKMNVMDIQKEFYKKHFLAGLVLEQIELMISMPSDYRMLAIFTFRNILWRHDNDERFNTLQKHSRLAQIYFPFVLIIIDNWKILNREEMEWDEKRSWLVCFVWILRHCSLKLVRGWWRRDLTLKRKKSLLSILSDCLATFEYPGAQVVGDRDIYSTWLKSKSILEVVESQSELLRNPHKKNFFKSSKFDTKQALEFFTIGGNNFEITLNQLKILEQNLGREISYTVISILINFISDHILSLNRIENVESDNIEPEKLFDRAFGVIIAVLSRSQTKDIYEMCLNQLRWIIHAFSRSLFIYRSSVCSELTNQIVHLLNSLWQSVRGTASATLLRLIHQNFREVSHFSRLKLLTTVSVSGLFARPLPHGTSLLRSSLSYIQDFAIKNYNRIRTKNSFLGTEIKELVARLEHIIENNNKINEYAFDPEIQADFYHQISMGYFDSPDLRLPELEKLAQHHLRQGNNEESAMVRLTQAILVAEYLRLLSRPDSVALPNLEFGLAIFSSLKSEVSMPKKVDVEALKQEICQSKIFSEDGYLQYLQQAVQQLKRHTLFENCVEVYRLIMPVYQFHRNYSKQADFYADLNHLCKLSVDQIASNNRISAQYYRVAFHYNGNDLKDLDKKQYVYKEVGAVRLDDMKERLRTQYGKKINSELIQFLSNLKEFDRSTMTEGTLYIQLVSIEPFLTVTELEKKQTMFEKQWNVSKFVYETPFIKGDSLKDQWKRKTIITTDGSFPNVKKRLSMLNLQSVDLLPIETAYETIVKKAQILRNEIDSLNPTPKTLQRELQGSLLLQVNAGPAAIAEEFLAPDPEISVSLQEKLKEAFIEFIRTLADGVALNEQLISVEQLQLQMELKNGYFRLKSLFCKLSNNDENSIQENFLPVIIQTES